MSNQLKVIVSKKDLELVVGRACLAAMTEEGQSEISKSSNATRGCVKIKAEGGRITFESSVSRFSAKHVVEVEGNEDASIISEGETCVPAKELKTVAAKIPNGYKVSLNFIPKAEGQDDESLSEGVLEVGGIDGKKTIAKAKIEAYPASHFANVKYAEASEISLIASGKAACLKEPYDAIAFSINQDDLKEVYDKMAVFQTGESIIFVGADGHRCTIVQSKVDAFEKMADSDSAVPVLMESEFIAPVLSSLASEDQISFGTHDDSYVYVCSGNTTYRISMVTQELRKKYPNYKRIMSLFSDGMPTFVFDRKHLAFSIDMLAVVNKDRGMHSFDKSGKIVSMLGRGFATVKEAAGEVEFEVTNDDGFNGKPIYLHTGYLVEGLKRMSCEKVRMSLTPDGKRVRIEDEQNPKFLYYMQTMSVNEG